MHRIDLTNTYACDNDPDFNLANDLFITRRWPVSIPGEEGVLGGVLVPLRTKSEILGHILVPSIAMMRKLIKKFAKN